MRCVWSPLRTAAVFLFAGAVTALSPLVRPVPASAGPTASAVSAVAFGVDPVLAYAEFVRTVNPRLPLAKARDYAAQVLADSERTNVDPRLIVAIVSVESHWNQRAVSRHGARGLGQLMPRTAADLGVGDAFSARQNLLGTSVYLRALLDRFRDHPQQFRLAIGAYNAGPNAVRRYGTVPPYAETQRYVKKVLRLWRQVTEQVARRLAPSAGLTGESTASIRSAPVVAPAHAVPLQSRPSLPLVTVPVEQVPLAPQSSGAAPAPDAPLPVPAPGAGAAPPAESRAGATPTATPADAPPATRSTTPAAGAPTTDPASPNGG